MQRRNKNRISRIKNEDGIWVENQAEIHQMVNQFFSNIYKSSSPTNIQQITSLVQCKVTDDMNAMLIRGIEDWEVKKAVYELGSLKAPGPDGLTGLFYQRHWNILQHDITAAVKEFFLTAKLPDNINSTHISLIPKIPSPEDINQLRPISCCNFIYKIFSKVLANRMKGVMKDIISDNQSAFLQRRQIQDNILVAHEIFHSLKQRQGKGRKAVVVKLDMSKAYDRLEWSFIKEMMYALGFNPHWVSLIWECISSVTYNIKLNGIIGEPILPERGLRQGDPLSPYLFIIAAEGLSTLLNEASSRGNLLGLKLAHTAPIVNHLIFADDSMIVTEANVKEAYEIQNILNSYTMASGQRINNSKSSTVFGKGVEDRVKVEFASVLRMNPVVQVSKYLGLPGEWQRSKTQALTWLKDRIW